MEVNLAASSGAHPSFVALHLSATPGFSPCHYPHLFESGLENLIKCTVSTCTFGRYVQTRAMIDNLLSPAQWALNEFGFAQLGDKRRNKRIVKIAESLARSPGGTLPQAFPDWDEIKAAYRFFDRSGATFERVIEPHLERVRAACRQPGEYLLIEDTTSLDFSKHFHTEDLGVIGDGSGRGFDLHSALALRVEGWTADNRPQGVLVGLFDQQCRAPRPAPKGETRTQLMKRPRKTQVWAMGVKSAGVPPQGCRWIYIADRESDCYEPLDICQLHQIDIVVRSCHDRCLDGQAEHLHQRLAAAPVLGTSTVEIRARPGQAARTAVVEIRSVRVDLKGPRRPDGLKAPLKDMGVIEAREVNPPPGTKEPLHWILLTSLPCASLEDALRVVGYYACRWWVEEYHKALKSGALVEESQLKKAYRLEALIAVLSVVAVRLLNTKFLARSRPQSDEAAKSFGPQALELLEKKLGKPKEGWTNQAVIRAIARLGGFIGRKSDGQPGWQTIWRGWQRLIWMVEAVLLISEEQQCG